MNGVVSGDTHVDVDVIFVLSMLKSHDVAPSVPISIVFVAVSVLLVVRMPGTSEELTSAAVMVTCAAAGARATKARHDKARQ